MPPFDVRWDANVQHRKHKTANVTFLDTCPICLGTVEEYSGLKDDAAPKEDDVGRRHHTPQDDNVPVAILKRDTYTRETPYTDEEAHAALDIMATISHPEAAKHLTKIVAAWIKNRLGDMNLEAGLNWDGSKIRYVCPEPSKCRKSYAHEGKCDPTKWSQSYNSNTSSQSSAVAGITRDGDTRAVMLADGTIMVNGVSHPKQCQCPPCLRLKDAAQGAFSAPLDDKPAKGSVMDGYEEATTSGVEMLKHYYEFRGQVQGGCNCVWVGRLIDKLECPSCGQQFQAGRRKDFTVKRIEFPDNDDRVKTYKRRLEQRRLAM